MVMEEEYKNPSGKSAISRFIREGLAYIGELLRVVVISLAIILPIRYFLVQPFYVKGASMEPNFYDHEYLVIDEISYRFRDPQRGEIVVFRYPADPSQFFIKRVIGLPGETLEINNAEVRIRNEQYPGGLKLGEPYLEGGTPAYGQDTAALGPDEYYLLGDNRASSLDSRQFGSLRRDLIIGRVWIRGWPFDRIGIFSAPEYEIGRDARNP